jgi:hypothetical protein
VLAHRRRGALLAPSTSRPRDLASVTHGEEAD